MECPAAGLFALDVSSLDDGPPFLGLGFLQCGERLGRLLVAWRNLHANGRDALANRWIGQRIDKRFVDRGDQTLRCAPGRKQSKPTEEMQPRQSSLVHGWDVGR